MSARTAAKELLDQFRLMVAEGLVAFAALVVAPRDHAESLPLIKMLKGYCDAKAAGDDRGQEQRP